MKKYYDIGQETENIIMQLKNKCQELNLGISILAILQMVRT